MVDDPRRHPEIAAAIALLEQGEATLPSQASADAFSEAFALLDDARAGGLDRQAGQFADNLEYAYTRTLLTHLRELAAGDAAAWLHYIVLVLVTQRANCERLRRQHPDLGVLFDDCVNNHAEQLAGLLPR